MYNIFVPTFWER